MHTESITQWQHTHIFGQDKIRSGEQRSLIVIIITALMMVVEIVAGIIFGSMALFADGVHMGSHMVGLGISFLAYIYSRRHARDQAYSFGTGKVNALAGYSSAIFLVIIALYMGYESVHRFIVPVPIEYNQAILVAVIGLLVNGASMLILSEKGHIHTHEGEHDHTHDNADAANEHSHADLTHARGTDHNLKAAYLHVLTDALTSVLAIVALLGAKYFKLVWMDPLMGMVGGVLVIKWSYGLIRDTITVLLDHQVESETQKRVTATLEGFKDTKVCDMHIWSIGPGIYSAEVSLVTSFPESPEVYKNLIPQDTGVVHSTIEVNLCSNLYMHS